MLKKQLMIKNNVLASVPCDIGDTVYEVINNTVVPYEVIGVRYGQTIYQDDIGKKDKKIYIECLRKLGVLRMSAPITSIGKTVYLSEEEAISKSGGKENAKKRR